MPSKRILLFVLYFVFSMSTSYAEPEVRDNKTDIITQILSLSGLDYQIEQLPVAIDSSMAQQPPPPIGRERLERFQKIYIDAFEPSLLRNTLVKHLDAHYDEKQFPELLTLVKSPLVRRMTELEKQASTPEAQQEMMMTGNIIMGQASPERLNLIRRIDEATHASKSMIEIQMMMSRFMAETIDPLLPDDKRLRPGQLEPFLEQMRAQSLYPAQQFIVLSMMFTFRSVSDDDLRAYLNLYESEIGRWSTNLMNAAFRKIFADAAQRIAENVKRELVIDQAA